MSLVIIPRFVLFVGFANTRYCSVAIGVSTSSTYTRIYWTTRLSFLKCHSNFPLLITGQMSSIKYWTRYIVVVTRFFFDWVYTARLLVVLQAQCTILVALDRSIRFSGRVTSTAHTFLRAFSS